MRVPHVGRHETMAFQHIDHVGEILPVISAGFRGAGSRQDRGIEPVQVNRQVQRPASPWDQGGFQGLRVRDQAATAPQFQKFLSGTAADGELKKITTGQDVETATHGAGMAVACSQPGLPEVGMGIELQQNKIGMLCSDSLHGTGADRVLTSQHQWFETPCQHGLRRLQNRVNHRLWRTKGNLHRSEISEGDVVQVSVELRAVALQPLAHLADRCRTETGAGPE